MTRPSLLSAVLYIILLEGWLAAIWVNYGLLAAIAAFVGYGVLSVSGVGIEGRAAGRGEGL